MEDRARSMLLQVSFSKAPFLRTARFEKLARDRGRAKLESQVQLRYGTRLGAGQQMRGLAISTNKEEPTRGRAREAPSTRGERPQKQRGDGSCKTQTVGCGWQMPFVAYALARLRLSSARMIRSRVLALLPGRAHNVTLL